MNNSPTAIDLFCGAGGLTQGLKSAGFRVLAALDIELLAIETFRENHPDVTIIQQEDIIKVDEKVLRNTLNLNQGELDLMAGCPPCQGFSKLRTRNKSKSSDDTRNDLIFEYLRFVEEFKPKAVMLENVPGLAHDERIYRVLASLKNMGYFVDKNTVRVEDASDYGVPQRRKRMILLSSNIGIISSPLKVLKKRTVKQIFFESGLPEHGKSGDPLHDFKPIRSEKVMNLIRSIPKDGGSRKDAPIEYWLPCHLRYPKGFRDVYGRMKWDDVAPTITGGCHNPSKGRFLHPEEDRAITLREAALLQSFPIDYKFSLRRGRDAVALLIGNALPPEFIRRHAIAILESIRNNQQGNNSERENTAS